MRKRVLDRLELVKMQSWDAFTERDKVGSVKGAPTSYFEEMGLEKRDLKLLERAGMAVRGYWPKNGLYETQNDKPVLIAHDGWEARWVLIK